MHCNGRYSIHYNDTTLLYFHLWHNRQFFRGYSPRWIFWHNFVEETRLTSCAQNTARGCWIGLSFLFACLNCDLYLFVQMQEAAKESSVWFCCPWDAALCMCTEHGAREYSVQLFLVFECFKHFCIFNLSRLKPRANATWRRAAVACQMCWAFFQVRLSQSVKITGGPPSAVGPYNHHHLSPH